MPTISMFYGIIIQMYWDEHAPPHFHAIYGEFKAIIDIRGLKNKRTPTLFNIKSVMRYNRLKISRQPFGEHYANHQYVLRNLGGDVCP